MRDYAGITRWEDLALTLEQTARAARIVETLLRADDRRVEHGRRITKARQIARDQISDLLLALATFSETEERDGNA